MTVEPGKFDAAAAVAALKEAHYPATKAEDVSPTATVTEETSDAELEGPTELPAESESAVEETTEPAETEAAEPAEATTEAAPKEETEVVE